MALSFSDTNYQHMSVVDGREHGDLTLAFTLDAIKRLADPSAAFSDAQEWSRHTGIIDDDRDGITRFLERHDLPQDYDLEDLDRWLALESVQQATKTPRHVYVGLTLEDRRVADHLGWEFVHIEEAATRADWTLEKKGESRLLDWLLQRIPFRKK